MNFLKEDDRSITKKSLYRFCFVLKGDLVLLFDVRPNCNPTHVMC